MSGRENRDLSLQAQGTAQDAGETRDQAQRQARGGMTNRERIMTELAGMNDQDLHNTLTNDNNSSLMDRLCYACEVRHGGECPLGATECLLWDGSWLRDEWDGRPLLEVNA
jgi:hypothetical protein